MPDSWPERCNKCYFWVREPGENNAYGKCRRLPPVMSNDPAGQRNGMAFGWWPLTGHDDWCGEYEMLEIVK